MKLVKTLKAPDRQDECICGTTLEKWEFQQLEIIDTDHVDYVYICSKCGRTIREIFLVDRVEIYEGGNKMKKKLAKYLADYVNQELEDGYRPNGEFLTDTHVLEQGLEAFESTENARIDICQAECDEKVGD